MGDDVNYDFSSLRVLYVEDISGFREMMKSIFESVNISNFDIVDNGIEAIGYCYKNKYDLIIMDCELPYMNGGEAACIIKENLEVDSPICICSASENINNSNFSKQCYDYTIPKPFSLNDITRLLKENSFH
ncbi:response regulator [Mycoplasmatota bacterium WC44]